MISRLHGLRVKKMKNNKRKFDKLILAAQVIYFTLAALVFFSVTASAYIDPSVMTYAIQALAGVAIALGTAAGLYFRRAKKHFSKKFNIDEDRNKKHDISDLYYFNPEQPDLGELLIEMNNNEIYDLKSEVKAKADTKADAKTDLEADSFALAPEARKKVSRKELGLDENGASKPELEDGPKAAEEKKEKWIISFFKECGVGAIFAAAFSFMFFVYAPLEMYITNKKEFWYDYSVISPYVYKYGIYAFLAILACFIVSYILYDKLFRAELTAGFIAYVILYIQGNYLAAVMPPMNGTSADWTKYTSQMKQSLILCIVVFLIVILALRFLKIKRFYKLVTAVSILITCMLLVSVVSIFNKYDAKEKKADWVATSNNELTMSKDKNFVILVLDATDADEFNSLRASNPEWDTTFKDFTFYPDTMSAYPFTEHSIPFILTGEWMENQEDYKSFETKAMKNSKLFDTLKNQGYRMGLYEQELVFNDEDVFEFENVMNVSGTVSSEKDFVYQYLNMAGYKYFPWQIKQHMTFSVGEFAKLRKLSNGLQAVTDSNTVFYNALDSGIDASSSQPCFRFIHVEGSHVPYRYNKDMQLIPEEEGSYQSNVEASMTIAGKYLDKLKEAGVYDNTAILIMADHGYNDFETEGRQNPLLLYKGIGETGDSTLKINNAPISHDDLQDAYQNILAGKGANDIFKYKDGDVRKRRFLFYAYLEDKHMVEYFTEGLAKDTSALKESGKVYDMAEGSKPFDENDKAKNLDKSSK